MIDWSKADTSILYKYWSLQDIHEHIKSTTLEEVANVWDDTKLIGYLTDDHVEAICELCKCLIPYGEFPRLYYECEGCDILCCFEFHPGTKTVLVASCYITGESVDETIQTGMWEFKPLKSM
jgi:hypothetical protein